MGRLVLALLLAAGCAEGAVVSPPSPDSETPQDGPVVDAGTDLERVCDAAVESLSGTAVYVKGSAHTPYPTTPLPAPFGTCGAYVTSVDAVFYPQPVRNGQIDTGIGWVPMRITGSALTADGCVYTLHADTLATGSPPDVCYYSADFTLTVP